MTWRAIMLSPKRHRAHLWRPGLTLCGVYGEPGREGITRLCSRCAAVARKTPRDVLAEDAAIVSAVARMDRAVKEVLG